VRRKVLKGVFRCSKLDTPLAIYSKARALSQKFISEQAKQGWELVGKPDVRKIRLVDEASLPGSRFVATGGIWHPNQLWKQSILPREHPLAQTVAEDQDLYIVWFPFQMRDDGKPVRIEVRDEVAEKLLSMGKITEEQVN